MKYIKCSKGMRAMVDNEDHEYLAEVKWFVVSSSTTTTWYAVRWGPTTHTRDGKVKRPRIQMANVIMRPGPNRYVDHINGNGLDNRRANLRLCTRGENNHNVRARGVSGFKVLHPLGSDPMRLPISPLRIRIIPLLKIQPLPI